MRIERFCLISMELFVDIFGNVITEQQEYHNKYNIFLKHAIVLMLILFYCILSIVNTFVSFNMLLKTISLAVFENGNWTCGNRKPKIV